jgi:predicted transcriptional regulator
MARLTITLSDERHRALKEAAIRRHTTIGAVIEESLERCGVKTEDEVLRIIEKAQRHATLSEEEALAFAVEETRRARRGE